MNAWHRTRLRIITLIIPALIASACDAGDEVPPDLPSTGILEAGLLFQAELSGGARDFTVDADGNLYIFDYRDYWIRKFAPSGEQLTVFGGSTADSGMFKHLTDIEVEGSRLLALDSAARFTFNLEGDLLDKVFFPAGVVCGHPVVYSDGRFVGEWIVEEECRVVLTSRTADGRELERLQSYDVRDFIPEIESGEPFFLSMNQMRSYRYDFLRDGRIVWAASDEFKIMVHSKSGSEELISREYTPVPFPPDQIEDLRRRKETLPPPLYVHVPEQYRLIHHLTVGTDGDIWIYVQSLEKTGFLRFNREGEERAFYSVRASFDPGAEDVMVGQYGDNLYFMVPGPDRVAIYAADIRD